MRSNSRNTVLAQPPSASSSLIAPTRSATLSHRVAKGLPTSRLPLSPKQPPSVPSCIFPSSVFYQVLIAQYRRHVHPGDLPKKPLDFHRLEMSRNSINWAIRVPQEETNTGSQSGGMNAAWADWAHHVYTPRERWAWARGHHIKHVEDLMQLKCM
jgi:hypothetical protein